MRPLKSRWLIGILLLILAGCGPRLPAPKAVQTVDLPEGSPADLEFKILANPTDDGAALDAAQLYFNGATPGSAAAKELEKRALAGEPPPSPQPADAKDTWPCTYSWVEAGPSELQNLGLHSSQASDPNHERFRQEVEEGRKKGEIVFTPFMRAGLYSRPCRNEKLTPEEREQKQVDYFLLTRDPEKARAITGKHLVQVAKVFDPAERPAISFRLSDQGGALFYELTNHNRPSGPPDQETFRALAIILEGRVISAPRIMSAIRSEGQISGHFTDAEVEAMIKTLRGQK